MFKIVDGSLTRLALAHSFVQQAGYGKMKWYMQAHRTKSNFFIYLQNSAGCLIEKNASFR